MLTNEEGVLTAMQQLLDLDQVAKISKILVCRDPLTNTSRGICYLFFDNLVDSMNVHNSLKELQPPLQLDGRDVAINYAIDGTQEGSAEDSRQQHKHGHESSKGGYGPPNMDMSEHQPMAGTNTYQYTEADVPRLAEYSAKIYATNAAEHDHYYKYYTQYYMGEIANGQFTNMPTVSQLGGETANSGAAVAQSAMQRKMQQQQQQGRRSNNGGRHSSESYGGDSRRTGGGGGAAPAASTPLQIPNGKDGKKYRE